MFVVGDDDQSILEVIWNASLRIPTQSGRGFRFDVGRRSDLMSATIPK
jgi:hypothetical protein